MYKMGKKNSRVLRVPPEFDNWIYNVSVELTQQTGKQHKKSDAMRAIVRSPIMAKKGKIDWRLL